jgi:hypothetical protein
MLKKLLYLIILIASSQVFGQEVRFYDSETGEPVSFATISFGNGLGTYANADGKFHFPKNLYADVDTLYISAMGYANLELLTDNLLPQYAMFPTADQLDEIILTAPRTGRFRRQEIKAISHNEYHNSWMQTVESEIAVLFRRVDNKPTQLASVLLPINVREEVSGRNISVRQFSTMMRLKLYENNSGLPGRELPYGNIVFVVTEKEKSNIYDLDLTYLNLFIPENGIFVSIQVLGPTDREGNFIQTKTYNEYETRRGIERIAISFRPLLPLTNQIPGEKTFVRRIFFNEKQWQPFNFDYNPNSELLRKGYKNYGMGAKLHVYDN